MNPNYKPYSERTPDRQYLDLIDQIRREGRYTKTPFQKNGTFTCLHLPPLIYKFENGFPLITERSMKGSWAKYVNELAAFVNGAVTLDQLLEYGEERTRPDWWPMWINPEKSRIFNLPPGHLGGASYGGTLAAFPTPIGPFNQNEHLLKQMRELPDIRTHVTTTWYPPGSLQHSDRVRDVIVAACHGTVVKFTIIDGQLSCNHVQRSWDGPLGGAGNISQYAAWTLWVAYILGLEPLDYTHYIMDGQIYEDQLDLVESELLKRESRPFPTLVVKPDAPKDLFAFRAGHFELTDYNPHPGIKFPGTE